MSDFITDKKCVTHHEACECRQKAMDAQVARLEGELAEAVKLLKRALAPLSGEVPWVREARRFLALLKGSA